MNGKVHHFADDTNRYNLSHSIKKMNKQVNYDLKNLNNWLNTNKICLNVDKTEVVLLKGYLRYKTITSQNVSSEAQIKNFFIL